MAITNGYATVADLTTYLKLSGSGEDTRLEPAIEAASRAIDAETRRVFYATSATRYFTPEVPDLLFLPDDLLSVSTLKADEDGDRTYERTWATTDYEVEPYNAAPYTRIRTTPQGRYSFPVARRSVEIVGSWGYNATGSYPDAINQAAIILATRYYKRKDAPFGVVGTPELGFMRVSARDPEVARLLQPFVRLEVM